jgi:hypothetical protein
MIVSLESTQKSGRQCLLLEGASLNTAAGARVTTQTSRVTVEQRRVLGVVGVTVPVPVRHDALVTTLALQSLLKLMKEVTVPGKEVGLSRLLLA